ncbi:hypothetical protein IQ247_18120 [Plectonema cf. radiosum LEGE 06105]|uniref:Uncharacterized protein n=1 Tax=Plectonema cf. radiosum LEGE 06105 TaxID=945769 RepID=A0A8J7K187_9CYAN|nr:hypothetical protein [Plectonema radiosum]MBE9214561.1 hypothetical protein [Plectonema cf. radiosum LEGE 06105]
MHTTNEKVDSWSKEARREFEYDPGRNRDARDESGNVGHQQERAGGADSPRPNFIGDGNPVTGKILRQLIDESENQVATKKAEILQLESKIQEFNALLEQLEANKKT